MVVIKNVDKLLIKKPERKDMAYMGQ